MSRPKILDMIKNIKFLVPLKMLFFKLLPFYRCNRLCLLPLICSKLINIIVIPPQTSSLTTNRSKTKDNFAINLILQLILLFKIKAPIREVAWQHNGTGNQQSLKIKYPYKIIFPSLVLVPKVICITKIFLRYNSQSIITKEAISMEICLNNHS